MPKQWVILLAIAAIFLAVLGMRGWLMGLLSDLNEEAIVQNDSPDADTPGAVDGFAGLDDEKQKSIWDAEHITFELETHFGKPFTKAIQSRSKEKLAGYFTDDFTAQIPTGSGEVVEHGAVGEVRLEGDDIELQDADTTKTIDYLINLLEGFESVKKVKLRVLQIAKVEPTKYRTKLLLTGFGKQNGMPIEFEMLNDADCQFTDDKEIAIGKILQSMKVTSQSVRQSKQALMEEVTEKIGLSEFDIHDNWETTKEQALAQHFQLAVEDFNKDGYPDIAIANAMKPPLLLRSVKGESFENLAPAMGIKQWRSSSKHFTILVGWIDYNNDGFPDLLMGDTLYRNVHGKKFVSVEAGLKFNTQPSGCVVADYDCDGFEDLYVMYHTPVDQAKEVNLPWIGDHASGAPNELWRNDGKGRFVNVTEETNSGGGDRQSFAAAWMFTGDDKYPDLYVANDFGENVLLENDGSGVFKDNTHQSNVGDFATSMGVSAGDLNNDGKTEIYVGNMFSKMGRRIIAHVGNEDYPDGVYQGIKGACAGNRLYTPGADSKFTEVSEIQGVNQVGWTHGVTMGDFDGDGWLDLYSTAGYMSFHRDRPDG